MCKHGDVVQGLTKGMSPAAQLQRYPGSNMAGAGDTDMIKKEDQR